MNTPLSSQEKLFPEQKAIRVTVPVTPEVQAAFQRLASVSGMSTGRAMGDWLADTMEGALTMADMLEKARRAPKQAVSEMHAYALGLADMTSELMQNLRAGKGKGSGAAGAAGARRPACPPAAPALPPLSGPSRMVCISSMVISDNPSASACISRTARLGERRACSRRSAMARTPSRVSASQSPMARPVDMPDAAASRWNAA